MASEDEAGRGPTLSAFEKSGPSDGPGRPPAEGHAVQRACGHWETLYVGRPWTYVDSVASLIPCVVCRRQGLQGPMGTPG